MPRFDYENHVRTLIEERRWPNSTTDISELRLVIDYQRQNGADRTLTLDIVDYPGEWLLDLPLLSKSFEQWSAESLALSREPLRAKLAEPWHAYLATLRAEGREDEQAALTSAKLFTDYLRACRDERFAMSLLPPGRFLMPGNLADSPALTFAPLDVPVDGTAPEGSLWAMMVRRYEAYKDVVVRPFFRDHFARLDRQIVLVDALAAFNAGPEALHDLEAALAGILDCFRIGRSTFSAACSGRASTASCLPPPRPTICIIRATTGWKRSCAAPSAALPTRAEHAGAAIDVVALAAVRATREAKVARGREKLPSHARHAARQARAPMARSSTARPKSRPFRATCPPIPKRCSRATAFAAFPARPRKKPTIASCASARRSSSARRRRSRRCLTSALTAPSSS